MKDMKSGRRHPILELDFAERRASASSNRSLRSSESTESKDSGYVQRLRSTIDISALGAVIQPPSRWPRSATPIGQHSKLDLWTAQESEFPSHSSSMVSVSTPKSPKFQAKPIWTKSATNVDELAKPASRTCCDFVTRWRAGNFVLDPWKGKMLAWGVLMLMLTVATAILIPYEIAFLAHDSGTLFWIQRFFDCCFIVDIVLRFFTMYYSSDEDARWIRDPRAIAFNYLRRDFIIDLVGLLPMDLFAVGWQRHVVGFESADLRPLVVLRLTNAARIGRLISLRQCYREVFGLSFAMLRIPDNICCTLYCAHLMACLWGFVGQLDGMKDSSRGWTGALQTSKNEDLSNMEDDGAIRLYIRSLYWSVMTITAIGYGDICPVTDVEYFVSTFAMSVGAIIWVYAIGKICGVIDTFNQRSRDRDKTMDDLERMMRSENLPIKVRQDLRWFFARRYMSPNMSAHLELLESMSPSLQAQVARRQIQDWLNQVPFMRDICESALVLMQCRRALKITMFCEGEHMDLPQSLCALRRGLALKGHIVLCRGSVWGAMDVLLTSHELMDPDVPIAINFVEVMHLSRQAIDALVTAFPSTKARIQKARIRSICLRGVKYEAMKRRRDASGFKPHVRFSEAENEHSDLLRATRSMKLQHQTDAIADHVGRLQSCHEVLDSKLDILRKRLTTIPTSSSGRSLLSRQGDSSDKPSLSSAPGIATGNSMNVHSATQKIRSIARRSVNTIAHEVEAIGSIATVGLGRRASTLMRRGLSLKKCSSDSSMASLVDGEETSPR